MTTRIARFTHLLGGLLALAASLAAAPAWERLAPLPVATGGFVAGTLNGEIIVAGGTTWNGDTKTWLDPIWAYQPGRDTWRTAGRLPAPTGYGVVVHFPDRLVWASGSSGTKTHTVFWTMGADLAPKRVATLPRGFVSSAGARIGEVLYVVGGTDDQGALERVTNHLHAVSLTTGAMTRLADYPEASLTTATAAAVGGHLYVFGGARWDAAAKTVVNHASAHRFSPRDGAWEKLPALPYGVRGLSAIALDERHIYLGGGYRSHEAGFVADAWILDTHTRQFRPAVPLPYAAMVGLVQAGDWLYCLGGEDRQRHRTSAAFRIRWRELLRD